MTFDFKHPNNTHSLKRNIKKGCLMATSLELMGINLSSIYLMAINNLHNLNGH